jgi:hypothetical protein
MYEYANLRIATEMRPTRNTFQACDFWTIVSPIGGVVPAPTGFALLVTGLGLLLSLHEDTLSCKRPAASGNRLVS